MQRHQETFSRILGMYLGSRHVVLPPVPPKKHFVANGFITLLPTEKTAYYYLSKKGKCRNGVLIEKSRSQTTEPIHVGEGFEIKGDEGLHEKLNAAKNQLEQLEFKNRATAAKECQIVIFTCVPERYAFIGEAAVVPL